MLAYFTACEADEVVHSLAQTPAAEGRVEAGSEASPESPEFPEQSSHMNPKSGIWGRRRLVRSSNLPRSSTTPVLPPADPDSATSGLVGSMSSAFSADRTVITTPTKVQLTPTSTNSSTPRNSSEGRKKGHGILNIFKHKERPLSSDSPTISPPVPRGALTSPKALRVLGLPSATVQNVEDSSGGEGEGAGDLVDGEEDVPPEAATKQSKFKEDLEEVNSPVAESVASANKSFSKFSWKQKNKKALEVLDIIPAFNPQLKSSDRDTAASTAATFSDLDVNSGYYSDGNGVSSPFSGSGPKPTPTHRGRRKKIPKPLDRMSPITETSPLEVVEEEYDDAELEVISEYSRPQGTSPIPQMSRSVTMPHFELRDEELPSSEEEQADIGDEGQVQETQGSFDQLQPDIRAIYRRGTKLQLKGHAPEMVQIKSPLQDIERLLLENTKRKMSMDLENSYLQKEHAKMKSEFMDLQRRNVDQDGPDYHTDTLGNNDPGVLSETESDSSDGVSIRSSINTDEEPTVHVAQAVQITRVTPGMVKLIDIPPRKTKTIHDSMVKATPEQVKAIATLKGGGLEVDTYRQASPLSDDSATPGSFHSSQFGYIKVKKERLPRKESNILIDRWINDASSAGQRPFSTRLDPDVLADQNLDRPPAPPPKDSSLVSPSFKHHCIHTGHLFRPLNLQLVADDTAVNDLQVSPYLRTPTGIKQHVYIPVVCQNCGQDVNQEIWECEVPVCKLCVCYACAVSMEQEFEGRAINTWQYAAPESTTRGN